MARYILVSDKEPGGLQKFLQETMETLDDYNVRSLAVVALLEDQNTASMSGYYNMGLQDKVLAKEIIGADVIHDVVRANLRDMLEELDQEEEAGG